MTFSPADTNSKISEREMSLYNEAFFEEALDLIDKGLLQVYDEGKHLAFHTLPEKPAQNLQLYGGAEGSIIVPIDEFADFRNLPSLEPKMILDEVKRLAAVFAESYISNVKNAYIKGGRLTGLRKLHVTGWRCGLKLNVAENSGGLCPDVSPVGWCAFRYLFAAAKA